MAKQGHAWSFRVVRVVISCDTSKIEKFYSWSLLFNRLSAKWLEDQYPEDPMEYHNGTIDLSRQVLLKGLIVCL